MGYPFDCHLIVGWPYADAWLAVSGFVRAAQGVVPRRRGVHGLSGLAALAGRVDGLRDLKRSGRPRQFTAVAAAWVKVLACALPAEMGVPSARWSHRELAAEAVTGGVVDSVSVSTVRRWLRADAIKPWQCRSWIFPSDPDFAVKSGRMLDLYDRIWDGQALGADEFVISADEKSQLQALARRHPDLPRRRVGSGVKSSNIDAVGRWLTSPPTTFTRAGSWAVARPRQGSSRSLPSSIKS